MTIQAKTMEAPRLVGVASVLASPRSLNRRQSLPLSRVLPQRQAIARHGSVGKTAMRCARIGSDREHRRPNTALICRDLPVAITATAACLSAVGLISLTLPASPIRGVSIITTLSIAARRPATVSKNAFAIVKIPTETAPTVPSRKSVTDLDVSKIETHQSSPGLKGSASFFNALNSVSNPTKQ